MPRAYNGTMNTKDSQILAQVENRRTQQRERSFEKTTYVDNSGVAHQTQIINSSPLGARLTTRMEVNVGDQLFIRQALDNGALMEVPVVVKWTKEAGLCQIVGVRILERLPLLASHAA